MLQTLSFLALKMENSGIKLIEAIAPGVIVKLDPALTRESRRFNDAPPEFTQVEVNDVVRRMKKLATYFDITPAQAIMIPAAFSRMIQDDSFDWDDMRRFYDVKSMVLLPLKKEFDKLVADKYFVPARQRRSSDYDFNPSLMEAVMSGSEFSRDILQDPNYDRYKFVREVSDLIEQRSSDDFKTRVLFEKTNELEKLHSDLSFVQNIQKLNLDIEERTFLYEICDDLLSNDGDTGINCTLKDMYEQPSTRFRIAKELKEERHALQKLGFIELQPAMMFNDTILSLTDKGKQIFLENDFDLFDATKKQDRKLLYPEKIAEKPLFYDKDLERQLHLFRQNLEEEKFADLQKRMADNALPKGVIALFYGLPGTGKTETALQIAKATGRAIYHVDISAAKTCWYGESQKLVKRIFTDYASMCEKETLKPILLFNEADALFSNRQNISNTSGSSSVAQTENAIQNIILEEMEKLDGIMIATTNMIDNLDSAFARRFLFKIKFGQPTVEAKQAIWHTKLAWLSEEDCGKLAAKFDFSGGEIDNIVRKVMMEEVLNGVRPDLAGIEELCRYEKIGGKKEGGIGFKTKEK